MFRRKSEKRILELSPGEVHLAKVALLDFRNKLIEQGNACLRFEKMSCEFIILPLMRQL